MLKCEEAIRMSIGDNPLKPIKILSINLVSNSGRNVWNVRLLDAYGHQFVKKVDAELVEACERVLEK